MIEVLLFSGLLIGLFIIALYVGWRYLIYYFEGDYKPGRKEIIIHVMVLMLFDVSILGGNYFLFLAYSYPIADNLVFGVPLALLSAAIDYSFFAGLFYGALKLARIARRFDFGLVSKYGLLVLAGLFLFGTSDISGLISMLADNIFSVFYPYTLLDLIGGILLVVAIFLFVLVLVYSVVHMDLLGYYIPILLVVMPIVGMIIMSTYPVELSIEGIHYYWVGLALVVAPFGYAFFMVVRKIRSEKRPKNLKKILVLPLLAIIIISSIGVIAYNEAYIAKRGMEQVWNSIDYSLNISEVPIVIDNLRLIDRDLARDFISTFSLPSSPTGWKVEKLLSYEFDGFVEGEPAWVIPFKYQTVFSKGKETNKIAGFIWLYLMDTPLPENIRYEYYEMDVGPALESFRNIEVWFRSKFPNLHMGEYYPVRKDGKWYWIILADGLIGNIYSTEKIIIVESFDKYRVMTPSEALKWGAPQVISSEALKSALTEIGNYLRQSRIDYTAPGVFMLEPESPDRLFMLEESFYMRPHHFLINNGSWFGRDFYMFVRISEKMKSVVLVTLINQAIKIIDLRGYRRGELQGVNAPTNALSVLQKIANETIGTGRVVVRYPKLYKFNYDNQIVLVWLALLVEELPGGDIFRGAVFVDAVDTRIKGLIQYTFGEPREVFISRLKQYIELTYKSFMSGNQTTVKTGKIINGTVLAKGWALEGSGEDMSFILTFRILNDTDIVIVVAKEEYMESKEQWYLATTVHEGEHVNVDLRFDPERQVWMLYRIEIVD